MTTFTALRRRSRGPSPSSPTSGDAGRRRTGRLLMASALLTAFAVLCACSSSPAPSAQASATPAPPKPEPVSVSELPLPPVAPSDAPGACTTAINPHGTGCVGVSVGLQSGGYLPDGHEVSATVTFAGAPAAPDPASIYSGHQLIIVKTDGTTFPDGDAWKCVTCGMPAANAVSLDNPDDQSYPQPFADGKRILAGNNVYDCGAPLADATCTGAAMHAYPIRWNTRADGSGKGGSIRELRLNPDQVHIGFNAEAFSPDGITEFGYLARLAFDPAPTTGLPTAPRYDLTNVTLLYNPAPSAQPLVVDPANPKQLKLNPGAVSVGEFRGFTKDGKEVLYIGSPTESDNIDLYAADLTTGAVRRLTSNPEYADPIDISPDDNWSVVMDTRGSGRQLFAAAMRGIPPLTDLVTTGAVSSIRNNGQRRFFQPYLIDRYGDRGAYQGQQLNAAGNGGPGAVNDPNWNGMADPRWSPDGTAVVYWQALAVPPACGGANPLPCEQSTEPGGRTARLMIAHLTSRTPTPAHPVAPISDTVPWGTPYVPGSPTPERSYPAPGTYTLPGTSSGSAQVTLTENARHTVVTGVSVTYTDFSDDGGAHTINGTESVTGTFPNPLVTDIVWHSDLRLSGQDTGTKVTSPDGFHLTINVLTNIFQATGTLTTTINGHPYTQPANGT